ncbi:MAG: hypothetical protein HY537_15280 [Deltaproteobacteria bacterium]|nr:hypothetical protein [Deltaproteobacteria bacterium]
MGDFFDHIGKILVLYSCLLLSAELYAEPNGHTALDLQKSAREVEDIIDKHSLVRPDIKNLDNLFLCRVQTMEDDSFVRFTEEDLSDFSQLKCYGQYCLGDVAPYEVILKRSIKRLEQWDQWLTSQVGVPLRLDSNETIPLDARWDQPAKNDSELKNRWQNILLWNVIQKCIQYGITPKNEAEVNNIKKFIISELHKSRRNLIEELKLRSDEQKKARLLTARLSCQDPHAHYVTKRATEESGANAGMNNNTDVNAGIFTLANERGTFITAFVPGSTSERSGKLRTKDQLLECTYRGTTYRMDHPSEKQDYRKLEFDQGSPIQFKVFRTDVKEGTQEITADLINSRNIGYGSTVRSVDRKEGSHVLRVVAIPNFVNDDPRLGGKVGTFEQLSKVMSNPAHFDAVVLDLRNNHGGSVRDTIDIANYFLNEPGVKLSLATSRKNGKLETMVEQLLAVPKTPEAQTSANPNGNSEPEKRTVSADDTLKMKPLFILVNRSSGSGAELLTKILQDNKRAVIVGETTFGKGIQQSMFPMTEGNADVTNVIRQGIDGSVLHNKGVEPDIYVPSLSGMDPRIKEPLQLPTPQLDKNIDFQRPGNFWRASPGIIQAIDQMGKNAMNRLPPLVAYQEALKSMQQNIAQQQYPLNYEKALQWESALQTAQALGGNDGQPTIDLHHAATELAIGLVGNYLNQEAKGRSGQ